jgi:hypothetical protein
MSQPNFPLIVIHTQEGLQIIPTEADLCKVAPFGKFKNTDQELVFDKEGNKWTYQVAPPQLKRSLAKKILDYILYNPIIEIKLEWTWRETYQIHELKKLLYQCITKYKGVTKIANIDAIKMAITKAGSFNDLYKALTR